MAALRKLIDDGLARTSRRPFVLGLCGAQGSGKSTLARALETDCRQAGIAAATLSLDDLYLPLAERERLAREVHPLFRTRGVPGTHDVALGMEVIAEMEAGRPVRLPRFDKAADDRMEPVVWPAAPEGCAVLIFEGWCVGAVAQDEAALVGPVNALEQDEDPQAIWRRHANAALGGVYHDLFARIDALALLAAPGFDTVFGWRLQQEEELAARVGADAPGVMDVAAIGRFIAHYERLTRHILAEMPARADLLVELGPDRSPKSITHRART